MIIFIISVHGPFFETSPQHLLRRLPQITIEEEAHQLRKSRPMKATRCLRQPLTKSTGERRLHLVLGSFTQQKLRTLENLTGLRSPSDVANDTIPVSRAAALTDGGIAERVQDPGTRPVHPSSP